MKITTLKQGSPDWHQFRSCHFGASEAPSMLGESKFKSRNQLLHEKATGIVPEVDAATQRRFDDGHRAEELARGLAEAMINDDLYPATGEEGKLSASFDGLTLDQSTAWEHKLLNDTLRACDTAADLPICYRIQMEQCLMLSGAERCLFSATKWDDAGNLIEEKHIWYTPDNDLRERLLQGWAQFAIDLENYQHVEHIERPKAEVCIELPALFIHARGQITDSNMQAYGEALTAKLAEVRAIQLITDQDFSNAKEAAKLFREQCKKLELAKEAMLSQTVTIGEAARMMDAWHEDLRQTALQLEKDVEREDKAKKEVMILEAKQAYADHVAALETETKPIRLSVVPPNFAEAIKGKRNYVSMHDAIGTMLAGAKMTTDAQAKDIRVKLAWFSAAVDVSDHNPQSWRFLFSDLPQIIGKPMDDFALSVTTRIIQHKIDIAAKEEEQRQRMEAEAKAKAEREAAEKLAEAEAKLRAAQAEEDALVDSIWKQARRVEGDSVQYVNKAIVQFETVAKAWESDPRPRPRVASAIADARQQLAEKLRAADERAKAEQDASRIAAVKELERTDALDRAVEKEQAEAATIEECRKQAQIADQIKPVRLPGLKTAVAQSIAPRRPNRVELLDAVATTFGTTNEAALDWILQEFRGDIQHEERKAA